MTKRILYILMISLLCCLSPQAILAQNIINPETPGSIHIHKLAVDNPEDYTQPATGVPADVTGMQPISGITFTVTRVADDAESPTGAVPIEGDGAYIKELTTNEQGAALFGNLAHGVYLVREEASQAVTAPVEDFLVRIPMTDPSGTGFLYDIHVYPKNQLIGLPDFGMGVSGKETMYSAAGLGEEVDWYITAGVPGDIAGAALYRVVCTFNEYLAYSEDSLSVYTRNQEGSQITLTETKDYSFTADGEQFTVEITKEGKGILADALAADFTPVLTVKYGTVFDITEENFSGALGAPLYNKAEFFYTNALNIPYSALLPEDRQPYVYTGGLNITKLDARNSAALDQAVFMLYESVEDARAGINPIPAPDNSSGWAVTTNGSGKAYFYGLPYGEPGEAYNEGNRTYYIVETQAPEGYNLLGAPIEAVVNAASHLEENAVTINNSSGFLLPVTGGMGTALFTVVGLILIAAAGYLLYRSRKGKPE